MKTVMLGGFLCALAACGPLTPPQKDAGSGGGAATGGGASTGGGATGGGGGVTGGGGGATGGGATGGGAGGDGGAMAWEFSSVGLSPPATNSGSIVGFAETDGGTFAVSSSGRVYRSTGGPFVELFTLSDGQPVDFEGSPQGELFAISTVWFYACMSDCGDAGAWTQTRISAANEVMTSLCVVSGTHAIAVGAAGGNDDGVYHSWNGTTFTAASTALGYRSPRQCWRAASGDFYFPVGDAVLRYEPGTMGFTPEQTPSMSWRGGGSALGSEWVAGLGPVISRRASGGTWTPVLTRSSEGAVNVVLGVSGTEAFAFGGGFNANGQSGWRWNGTAWAELNPDLPLMNTAVSAIRLSNGTIYVGGNDQNQYPVIVRGLFR
jgi:hypothetical protein